MHFIRGSKEIVYKYLTEFKIDFETNVLRTNFKVPSRLERINKMHSQESSGLKSRTFDKIGLRSGLLILH